MEFVLSIPQTELEEVFGGYFYINALGKIEQDDDKKFAKFLETSAPPPTIPIYIDPSGGNVEAAIKIGRMVRGYPLSTSIGLYQLTVEHPEVPLFDRELLPGKCLSAATLIYLAGRLRHFPEGAKFGVHQFFYKNPTPENVVRSQSLSAKIARYVTDMGIDAEFLEVSSSVPNDDIKIIDAEELRKYRVVTDGQTNVNWTVQAHMGMLYVRGERDSIFGHHKVMLCHSRETGFVCWSVIESQGREEELNTFGLVEIVLNDEQTRIDISDRCQRMDHGPYVNILSRISEMEAREIAYSDDFGIQVRFSKKAEVFLGIAGMATEGGIEQLKTLFHNFAD